MNITLTEIVSGVAVLVSLYAIISQRRYRRAQEDQAFSQADSTNIRDALTLKAEYKADLKDLRLELDAANAALQRAQTLIGELADRDRKREAAMNELQSRFDRDALLRANVEEALKLSNEKISELTTRLDESQKRISALEDELDKRDARIRELEGMA